MPILIGTCVTAEPKTPKWILNEPLMWDITKPSEINLRKYSDSEPYIFSRDLKQNQTSNYTISLNGLILNVDPINLSWTGDIVINFELSFSYNDDENTTPVNMTLRVLHADKDFLWMTASTDISAIVGLPSEYTVKAFSYRNPNGVTYSLHDAPTDFKINSSRGIISWNALDLPTRTISITVIASDGISEINYTFNVLVYLLKVTIDVPSQGARITGKVIFHGMYFGPPHGYVKITYCGEKRVDPKCWTDTVLGIEGHWTREFNVHYGIVKSDKYTLSVQPCFVDDNTHSTYCTMPATTYFYADKSNSYIFADPLFVIFMMVLPIICIIVIGLVMLKYSKK
jgi:hypothetical protein